eukprot:TRINITY_DN6075_c0_g1_i2.p1 TRINITY_DN6075_c0_g1~~TRINITY_DN6075_c0_g1_i2.p1  ORF type:complete len:393 (-),score=55.24 TRINITY_DN6075_c0_g1_i2:439-1617(-)
MTSSLFSTKVTPLSCSIEELFHDTVNSSCNRIKLILQSLQGLSSHMESWQILTRESSPSKPYYKRSTLNAPLETLSSFRNDVFASLLEDSLKDLVKEVRILRYMFERGEAKLRGKIGFFKEKCSGVGDSLYVVISDMESYEFELNHLYVEKVLVILREARSFLDQVSIFISDYFLDQDQLIEALKVIVPPRLVIDVDLSVTNLYNHKDLHEHSSIYLDCLVKMNEVVDVLGPREIILTFSGFLDELENPIKHHLDDYNIDTVTEFYLSAINGKKPSHPLNHTPTLLELSETTNTMEDYTVLISLTSGRLDKCQIDEITETIVEISKKSPLSLVFVTMAKDADPVYSRWDDYVEGRVVDNVQHVDFNSVGREFCLHVLQEVPEQYSAFKEYHC